MDDGDSQQSTPHHSPSMDDYPQQPHSAAGTPQPPNGPPSAANSGIAKRYRPAPAKTFQCRGFGECRMVFSRSEHLARHIRKHTGERPFSCHCGKQFSRLDNLRQHAQTVHSDKHNENEIMMRELTSLHTQLAARSTKANRETGNGAGSAKERRAAAAAAAAGQGPPGPGGPGYDGPPGPYGPPGPMSVAIPYQNQMPHYPPPGYAGMPGPPPPGPYPADYHSGYYGPPPPHVGPPGGPYGSPGYPPQFPHGHGHPYGGHSVRYAPYPPATYPSPVSGQYPPGPYGEPTTSSPGPQTPLTPSSTTPLSTNSAGGGHTFLGSGPPSAGGSQGGSFLAAPGGNPRNGSHSPVDPSGRSPDPNQHHAGHSFRTHLHSPVPEGYDGGGGGQRGQHPQRRSPDDQQSGDDEFDGRSIDDNHSVNGNNPTVVVGPGFRERGAGADPGFGGRRENPNAASRKQHHQSSGAARDEYGLDEEHRRRYGGGGGGASGPGAGFSGAAGRGGDYGLPTRPGSGYEKDFAKEVPPSTIDSRRPPSSQASAVGFHSENGVPSQRGSSQRATPGNSRAFRPSTGPTAFSRPPEQQQQLLQGAVSSDKPTPVLPPLASVVSNRPPSTAERQLGRFRDGEVAGGYEGGYARPGTAPVEGVGGDGPPDRHRSGLAQPPGPGDGARQLLPSRSGSGYGERVAIPGHHAPLPINTQLGVRNPVGARPVDASPVNDSPFTFHPPDVPFSDVPPYRPTGGAGLDVPRSSSGRPFSGVSSLGAASPFSGRPSTSGSTFGRPMSSGGYYGYAGYGAGQGVRPPGTGNSTTDPASYAFTGRGTKRPYTADSSDGGSASGRDPAFQFGGHRPATATAPTDDDRPPSRRLSLMELCTPPATSSGARPASGWSTIGVLGVRRPTTSDTGSRWTGPTAIDEGDDHGSLSPRDRAGPRRPSPSVKTDHVAGTERKTPGPSESHHDASPHSPPTRSDDVPRRGQGQLSATFTSDSHSIPRRSDDGARIHQTIADDNVPVGSLSTVKRPSPHAGSTSPRSERLDAEAAAHVRSPSGFKAASGRKFDDSPQSGPQSLLPRSRTGTPRSPPSKRVRDNSSPSFARPDSDADERGRDASATTPTSATPRHAGDAGDGADSRLHDSKSPLGSSVRSGLLPRDGDELRGRAVGNVVV